MNEIKERWLRIIPAEWKIRSDFDKGRENKCHLKKSDFFEKSDFYNLTTQALLASSLSYYLRHEARILALDF
ncbi:MAG: hypothetical protein ABFS56_27255 [Pseudomonadota bacterium]